MEYIFIFYIFISFILSVGGAFVLFSNSRTLAAILYLVGIVVIEIYFGTKWFNPNGTKVTTTATTWPPALNICPDFLSLYKQPTSGKSYCVDTVGISSSLTKWTTGSTITDTNVFNLSSDKAGTDRTTTLCADAKRLGLTWEGVWDGTTCLGGQPPLPK